MEWTLAKIRSKVRELVAMPDTAQLSNSDLDDKINNFYQYVLPVEVNAQEEYGWYSLSTTIGTGEYALDSDMLSAETPITINGSPIVLYLDAELFFNKYPRDKEGSTTYNKPVDCLWFNRVIYLRPIPDDTYTLKVKSYMRAIALSDTTDTPDDQLFGPFIAYGVAIEIFMEEGDKAAADELGPLYESYKTLIIRKNIMALKQAQSIPKF